MSVDNPRSVVAGLEAVSARQDLHGAHAQDQVLHAGDLYDLKVWRTPELSVSSMAPGLPQLQRLAECKMHIRWHDEEDVEKTPAKATISQTDGSASASNAVREGARGLRLKAGGVSDVAASRAVCRRDWVAAEIESLSTATFTTQLAPGRSDRPVITVLLLLSQAISVIAQHLYLSVHPRNITLR